MCFYSSSVKAKRQPGWNTSFGRHRHWCCKLSSKWWVSIHLLNLTWGMNVIQLQKSPFHPLRNRGAVYSLTSVGFWKILCPSPANCAQNWAWARGSPLKQRFNSFFSFFIHLYFIIEPGAENRLHRMTLFPSHSLFHPFQISFFFVFFCPSEGQSNTSLMSSSISSERKKIWSIPSKQHHR